MCVYISELCYVFHVHALALIVIPVEQHVTELAALYLDLILILDPCVSRTQQIVCNIGTKIFQFKMLQ